MILTVLIYITLLVAYLQGHTIYLLNYKDNLHSYMQSAVSISPTKYDTLNQFKPKSII